MLDLFSKEQILLISDFNTEKYDKPKDELCNICNLFSLTKVPICHKNPSKLTCIYLMLTNPSESFYNSCAIETGLPDFHKMTITIMKTTFRKQEPKIIHHRDYKNFSNNAFRKDLLLEASCNGHVSEPDNFPSFINAGVKALNKHMTLVKRSMLGQSKAPFMNKILKKAILHPTKPKNIFLRNWSDETKISFNKQRNYCVSL